MQLFSKVSAAALITTLVAGCSTDADVASHNLSQDADNFKINRRVVFYNGITADYVLSIEGLCALKADDGRKISITCKTGEGIYKKHYLGLSDNVTYFIEQLDPAAVGAYRYKVTFKPSVILPDITVKAGV